MGAMIDPPREHDADAPEMDFIRREQLLNRIERLRRQPQGERLHQREIDKLEREIASLY